MLPFQSSAETFSFPFLKGHPRLDVPKTLRSASASAARKDPEPTWKNVPPSSCLWGLHTAVSEDWLRTRTLQKAVSSRAAVCGADGGKHPQCPCRLDPGHRTLH